MDKSEIMKRIMDSIPGGRRKIERPNIRWRNGWGLTECSIFKDKN